MDQRYYLQIRWRFLLYTLINIKLMRSFRLNSVRWKVEASQCFSATNNDDQSVFLAQHLCKVRFWQKYILREQKGYVLDFFFWKWCLWEDFVIVCVKSFKKTTVQLPLAKLVRVLTMDIHSLQLIFAVCETVVQLASSLAPILLLR